MNTDGLPAEQLAAIEQRANAAARGPWWNDGHEIYQGAPEDVDPLWIGETCNLDLLDKGDANAAFIAAARQAVPDLVAEVRRLTVALAAEQAAHEDTRASLAAHQLLAGRCGNKDRGRRCDQSAGHPGDHQALGETNVSYVWARS